MKSFIDSQLLIGLLNPEDDYHEKARELINSKDVWLLEAVEKEVRGTFLRKYNEACIRVLKIINKLRLSNLENPDGMQEFVEKELEKLIRDNEKLENFYRFIFNLIKDKIIVKERLIEIPQFLDDYGVEILNSISHIAKRIVVKDEKERMLKTRNEIYQVIRDVNFKHLRDLEICCEAVAFSLNEEAEFLTGDKEFYDKALVALDKLNHHGYNPKLRVKLVE